VSSNDLKETGLLAPRRLVVQILGSAVGLALLAWCIHGAIRQGQSEENNAWQRLADAEFRYVVAMLACSLVSTICNGAMFWITIRPLKPLRFSDMQLLNLVSSMLNYAPIRLGMIARVAYNLRVDRLSLLQIGGWFAFIAYFLALAVGSCILASLLRGRLDWIWGALVLGQMILGALVLKVFVGNRLIVRYGRGIDRLISDPVAIWGAVAIRLVDLAAFTGRMAAAMAILGIDLPTTETVMLAIVALMANLIPFGRLGFREACVAAAAGWFSLEAGTSQNVNLLALLDSAGEALVFLPLGAIALIWYRGRMFRRAAPNRDAPDPA
jgi:hypothetical protein